MHPLDVFCSLKDFDPKVMKKMNYRDEGLYIYKSNFQFKSSISKYSKSFNNFYFLPFEVSDEFVSTEREELDFLIVETAEETKDEEVMEDTELSFFDSKEFFFTAETDFDLEVLLLELSDSAVVSSVDSTENKVSCNTLSNG